jgi:ankyrin repeat protein
MNENSDIDYAKELIRLCRAGRLHDIDRLISEGKSLDISNAMKRGRQRSLVEVAVETGFHSLIELIARNEPSQSAKDAALGLAVSSRRLDIVELLLVNGADIKAVPLVDVLLTWEPVLIRFFLDHGADPVNGRPFAEAFGAKVRTALRAFIDYKRAHPELAAQLQEQIDCALRHFCFAGDLKWVSLLMWAGADPRSRGPKLEEEYTEDPECYTSGLEEACYSEDPDVLKRLKPDASRDNLAELLHQAAFWGRSVMLEYLLGIGAVPNDKINGGSSALDSALRNLSFIRITAYTTGKPSSQYDARQTFDCVRELLSHGAIWSPDSAYELNSLRRALLECEPDVTIELLQLFRKHCACPAETVHKLLGTPRMREHMKSEANALLRLGIHLEDRPNSIWRRSPRRIGAGR